MNDGGLSFKIEHNNRPSDIRSLSRPVALLSSVKTFELPKSAKCLKEEFNFYQIFIHEKLKVLYLASKRHFHT